MIRVWLDLLACLEPRVRRETEEEVEYLDLREIRVPLECLDHPASQDLM